MASELVRETSPEAKRSSPLGGLTVKTAFPVPGTDADKAAVSAGGMGAGGMGSRSTSLNSLSGLWNWVTGSPSVSQPSSRNNSLHGGNLSGPGKKASPSASRDNSAHGGNLFKPMSREGSIGTRLWMWATSGELPRDRSGPDQSTFQSATSPERARSPELPGSPAGRAAAANSDADKGV